MKFKDFKYERISYETIEKQFTELLEALKKAEKCSTFRTIFDQINSLRSRIQTMVSLASCRNSIDSNNQFYVDEMAYWDETNPQISVFVNQFLSNMFRLSFKR